MTRRTDIISRTNGMIERMVVDDTDLKHGLMVTQQDTTDVERAAQEIRETANWGLTRKEPMRHVAKIPQIVLDRAMREGWFNDSAAWTKWANDPANSIFRTWPGKI